MVKKTTPNTPPPPAPEPAPIPPAPETPVVNLSLKAGQVVTFIPIDQLIENTLAPREDIEKGLAKLKKSIKAVGVLEPIVVRPAGSNQYEVISGNRRLAVAKQLKLQVLPCIIKEMEATGVLTCTYVTNDNRVALSKVDKRFIAKALVEGVGQAQACKLLSVSPKAIENLIAEPVAGAGVTTTEAVKEAVIMLDAVQTIEFVKGNRESAVFTEKPKAEAGASITLVGVLGMGKVSEVNEVEGGFEVKWTLVTG